MGKTRISLEPCSMSFLLVQLFFLGALIFQTFFSYNIVKRRQRSEECDFLLKEEGLLKVDDTEMLVSHMQYIQKLLRIQSPEDSNFTRNLRSISTDFDEYNLAEVKVEDLGKDILEIFLKLKSDRIKNSCSTEPGHSYQPPRESQPGPLMGICAPVYEDAEFLAEWFSFHELMGFSKFLLYDLESKDFIRKMIESKKPGDLFAVTIHKSNTTLGFSFQERGGAVYIEDINPVNANMEVQRKFRSGDKIVGLNGHLYSEGEALVEAMTKISAGEAMVFTIEATPSVECVPKTLNNQDQQNLTVTIQKPSTAMGVEFRSTQKGAVGAVRINQIYDEVANMETQRKLMQGDIILELNGEKIGVLQELFDAMAKIGEGELMVFSILAFPIKIQCDNKKKALIKDNVEVASFTETFHVSKSEVIGAAKEGKTEETFGQAYINHCRERMKELGMQWVALLNVEEFIYPIEYQETPTVSDSIIRHQNEIAGASCLSSIRLSYGSSFYNKKPDYLVTESYLLRQPSNESEIGGIMVNLANSSSESHIPTCQGELKAPIFRVNRYLRSLEDVNAKMIAAFNAAKGDQKTTMIYSNGFNQFIELDYNDFFDGSVLFYSCALRKKMGMGSIPKKV